MKNLAEFKTLWPYLLLHKWQFITGTAAVIVGNFLVLFPAYFVRLIIDGLTGQLDQLTSTPGITVQQVLLYSLGILLSQGASGVLMLIMRRKIIIASRQIEYEVRRDLFAHLQTLDKHYYDRARTGDLMNRLTGDLSAVREMLGFGSWQIINIITSFLAALAVMFSLSWQLTLVVVGVLPIVIIVLTYLSRLVYKRHKASQEQSSLISAKAQENFSGVRVVKGYAIEDREIAEYKQMNLELLQRNIALTKVEGPIRSFSGLVLGISFALILWVGGREIVRPDSSLTLGMLVQFIAYLERLAWPMLMAGWITGVVQRGLASWLRLKELYDAKPKIDQSQANQQITQISGQISFNNVSLKYDNTAVLKDINFEVSAGTFLGVTGPTGSGKTLLAQLITRSIDPSSGSISMDGYPLPCIPLALLRQHIGVVPQEPFLFSDTIANNIAFGLNNHNLPEIPTHKAIFDVSVPDFKPPSPEMKHIIEAAQLAGLADDIDAFPDNYQTMLGERGVTLSGGQRQRTAIARAIVTHPSILILDDSLSAVDTETERRIIDGLRQVAAGRTVILIGHRVSTLRHADQIIVLKEGQLIEQGTHQQLITSQGHYAEIERLQRLAKDLENDGDSAMSEAAL